MAPLRQQARRGDDQRAFNPPKVDQDSESRDRLDRLAKTHIVGKEKRIALDESADAFVLIGVERRVPLEQTLRLEQCLERGLEDKQKPLGK
jgi:hypothetical protein